MQTVNGFVDEQIVPVPVAWFGLKVPSETGPVIQLNKKTWKYQES